MKQEDLDWIKQVGITIAEQLFWSIDMNVFYSWGVSRKVITTYEGMPTLALRVNGELHKGWVNISLNVGSDTYEVRLMSKDNKSVKKLVDGIYCDNLGIIIDELVECPAGITKEEYKKLIFKSQAV